jgi:hypothetical protein
MARNNHLLGDALFADEVMDGEIATDESDEPSNLELLEYLGLDEDEINAALDGTDMNTGLIRFENKYSKEPSASDVNTYLGGTTKGQSTFAYSRCTKRHDGSEYIFKAGSKTIGGAKGTDLESKYANLVIDLAGAFCDRVERWKRDAESARLFIKSGPERFNVLKDFIDTSNTKIAVPELVRLDWPDMRKPPVTLQFWQEMWNLLPEGHTIFCCIGGHGRTGTALAAMMIAADRKMSAKKAIDIVREFHCKDAIETTGQEDYLEDIASVRDTKLRKKGSK